MLLELINLDVSMLIFPVWIIKYYHLWLQFAFLSLGSSNFMVCSVIFSRMFISLLQHTGTEHKFDIKIERPPSKPDVWEELLSILEKILDFCVCCITCGCYKRERNGIVTDEYGMILLDNEKQAVQNLLQYLEKGN